ncbi:MAG: hypothetical protein Q8P41_17850, partial [Pseudomonadota bacterium]|nr:hypothetical protein [Pseudomonadota bacterium]
LPPGDSGPATPVAPAEGSPRFGAWISAVEAGTELRVQTRPGAPAPVRCEPGATLAAWREAPSLPPPDVVCQSALGTVERSASTRISELAFASEEHARVNLDMLLERGDGGDPLDACRSGACKALVSGWVEGTTVYWVTTRAAAWREDGCAALRAAGAPAPRGSHRCG